MTAIMVPDQLLLHWTQKDGPRNSTFGYICQLDSKGTSLNSSDGANIEDQCVALVKKTLFTLSQVILRWDHWFGVCGRTNISGKIRHILDKPIRNVNIRTYSLSVHVYINNTGSLNLLKQHSDSFKFDQQLLGLISEVNPWLWHWPPVYKWLIIYTSLWWVYRHVNVLIYTEMSMKHIP